MKNASCFMVVFHVQKTLQFLKVAQSGKFVKPTTCSLDSPYTEHNDPHFHTKHHLNRSTHEYNKHD